MIVCDLLFAILVHCMMQGMAQVDRPEMPLTPERLKTAECKSLLDPAPDPELCACNVIRGIPAGAIFTYPPTKGIAVDWAQLKASVHYWKCFPKSASSLSPSDYSEDDENDRNGDKVLEQ